MAFYFDLEDYAVTYHTICDRFRIAISENIKTDIEKSEYEYYKQYSTYDGFTPKQETLIFENDGSISVYFGDQKTPLNIGELCCKSTIPYLISTFSQSYNLFTSYVNSEITWDANNQKCKWKNESDVCEIDSYKLVLNPVNDDGAFFQIGTNDNCSLTIDFSYLFKFDCDEMVKLLTNPNNNIDPVLDNQIKDLKLTIYNQTTTCKQIENKLTFLTQEFNKSQYSIYDITTEKYYCIVEENDGLIQLQNLIGAVKYKRFIDGEEDVLTSSDINSFLELNALSIRTDNKELLVECNVRYGYKSSLKLEIDKLLQEQTVCNNQLIKLENSLTELESSVVIDNACSSPISILENFNSKLTLDVVESDGSLTTVAEYDLFNTIGDGNLFNYLENTLEVSGFYFCSLPNENETWTTGCTPLIAYEFTAPEGLLNKEPDLNVSTCNIVRNNLISELRVQSGYDTSQEQLKLFNESLHKKSFASNWVKYFNKISDTETISKLNNKKIKISLKLNNTCGAVCVYLDNIKLTKECVDGETKILYINESPGFELERVIDNKKSWINNTIRVNREFDIENVNNSNTIRETDYFVNDERLVINTKEIDLNVNTASAIETDLQCFVNDNLDILDGTPSYDCGCVYECYSDIFTFKSGSEITNNLEDIAVTLRVYRDAWLKAFNELRLATLPYLDIKNGLYHPNPSPDTFSTYIATKNAYTKALRVFNEEVGGGFIYGLNEMQDLYAEPEKMQQQMFNTKCGRILKIGNSKLSTVFYVVETLEKELKLYVAMGSIAPMTTWFDLSDLFDASFPNTNWLPSFTMYNNTPENNVFTCKYFSNLINYVSWAQLMVSPYTNNNIIQHVNDSFNPANQSFFVGFNHEKNKCMTNMFEQVVPKEFSTTPVIIDPSWNYRLPYTTKFCDVDIWLRISGGTDCTTYGVDFTWPNISSDINRIYRRYRDVNISLNNEIFLTNSSENYQVMVKDPNTNIPPDETLGKIPVKVTTTIRKDSPYGDIVYQEEYVLNDNSATCYVRQPTTYGLNELNIPIGIADPNSFYRNPSGYTWCPYCSSDYGTHLFGSISGLPCAAASDDGINRNWRFDKDYYVHLDVVNNLTNEVYYIPNNDFNLRDRNNYIKHPSSASTQTFNINNALDTINTFKTTILGQIQEDIDNGLSECVNC